MTLDKIKQLFLEEKPEWNKWRIYDPFDDQRQRYWEVVNWKSTEDFDIREVVGDPHPDWINDADVNPSMKAEGIACFRRYGLAPSPRTEG